MGSRTKFARNGKGTNRNKRLHFDLILDIRTNFILKPINFLSTSAIGDFQKCTGSSYVYVTIYGHKKKVCLEQNISIGSIVWN